MPIGNNIFSRHIAKAKRLRAQSHNCLVDIYNPVLVAPELNLFNDEHINNVSTGEWEELPTYSQTPAMISFNPATNASPPSTSYNRRGGEFMKDMTQVARLIIAPDLEIRRGAKIVVTYIDWNDGSETCTRTFIAAGGAREGQTAQIIFFQDKDYLG